MADVYDDRFLLCYGADVCPRSVTGSQVGSHTGLVWNTNNPSGIAPKRGQFLYSGFDTGTFPLCTPVEHGTEGLYSDVPTSAMYIYFNMDCYTHFRARIVGLLGSADTGPAGYGFCDDSTVIVTQTTPFVTPGPALYMVVLHTPGYDQTWTDIPSSSSNLTVEVDWNISVQIQFGSMNEFVTGPDFQMRASPKNGIHIQAGAGTFADSTICGDEFPATHIVSRFKLRTFDVCPPPPRGGGLIPWPVSWVVGAG